MKIRFFIALAMLLATTAWGWDATPQCFREVERSVFTEKVVGQALSIQRIPQGSWTAITRDLRYVSAHIHPLVWRAGQQMQRNPLEYPFELEPALKLLKEVLYPEFERVLIEYEIYNSQVRREIYEYVWKKQSPQFQKCRSSLDET